MEDKLDQPVKELIKAIPQQGEVIWIGVRPERRAELNRVDSVFADKEKGLEGDHFSGTYSKKRQVTFIQKEHLDGVASLLHRSGTVAPELARRNVLVKGINLLSLRNQYFSVGEAIFKGTGYCHPCSRMEENLGPGGYNAMRGHGGITASIVKEGKFSIGDAVVFLPDYVET